MGGGGERWGGVGERWGDCASSKMSSTPASVHVLRSLWSHSLYPGVGPTLRLFDCSTYTTRNIEPYPHITSRRVAAV